MKIFKRLSFVFVLPFLFGFTNIAHRGDNELGKYPEHSFEAYDHAVVNGADYLELDLQKTRDNVLVVSHDENLGRVFGVDQEIEKSNFNDLRQVKNRAGEPVLSLSEVFQRYQPERIKFMLETKDGQAGMEKLLVKEIKQHHLENRVLFESFSLISLKKLAKLMPTVPRTQLGGNYRDVGDNQYYSSGFYDKNASRYLQSHNKGYIIWGADKKKQMRKLMNDGVTGLITDYPGHLSQVLGQHNALTNHKINAEAKIAKPFAIVKNGWRILPRGSQVKIIGIKKDKGVLDYQLDTGDWLSERDVTQENPYAPQAKTGQIYLTHASPLWRDPLGDKSLRRSLRANSKWNYYAISSVSGHKFYNLGSNQWIDGKDVAKTE